MLEEGTNAQTIENGSKPVVEIGKHCEGAEIRCSGKEIDGLGIESPGRWLRKMFEKGIEVDLEDIGIENGGGVRND